MPIHLRFDGWKLRAHLTVVPRWVSVWRGYTGVYPALDIAYASGDMLGVLAFAKAMESQERAPRVFVRNNGEKKRSSDVLVAFCASIADPAVESALREIRGGRELNEKTDVAHSFVYFTASGSISNAGKGPGMDEFRESFARRRAFRLSLSAVGEGRSVIRWTTTLTTFEHFIPNHDQLEEIMFK